MSDEAAPPRSRSPRPSRAEEEIVSRRTRGLNDHGLDSNLWVIEGNLDRSKYAYRWVNNTPQRMTKLNKMDDWDPVDETEAGFSVERHGDSGLGGATACQARLMKKPRILYERHHKENQRRLLEQEATMTRGIPLNQLGDGNTYTPPNANQHEFDRGTPGIVESSAPVGVNPRR